MRLRGAVPVQVSRRAIDECNGLEQWSSLSFELAQAIVAIEVLNCVMTTRGNLHQMCAVVPSRLLKLVDDTNFLIAHDVLCCPFT